MSSIPTTSSKTTVPVGGYDDDCAFVSERAKILHIRNCPGYGDPMPATTFTQPDAPQNLQVIQQQQQKQQQQSQPVECIDNTGSANDEGYSQGYVDAQRDFHGLNGHGFDDSVNHGNSDFKFGYHIGYNAAWNDAAAGVNKNPC